MGLPKEKYIELPLLHEIEMLGGSVQRSKAPYEKISSHFPMLKHEDLKLTNPSDGVNYWEKRVNWARDHLARKGEIDKSVRGIWKITEKGRERLRREWSSWSAQNVEYSTRLYLDRPRSSRRGARTGREQIRPPQPPVGPLPPTSAPGETTPTPLGIAEALRQRLEGITFSQFQGFCRAYLEKKGLRNVRVTGQTRDGGIDGDGEVPFLGVKAAFQAKKWAQSQRVGSPAVRDLRGAIEDTGFERGIIITTSSFTDEAIDVANSSRGRIILIDGQRLAQDCIEMQLGIKPVTTEAAVDEDFFNAL